MHKAHYYSKFNIRWGYNNICIKEGNEWKAAFKTPLGLFEPTVMTFSLCNAPATFQTFMNNIFEDMINTGHAVAYLDDILIFAEDLTLLNKKLSSNVLACLEKYDLLKPEKCSFAQTSIEYLSIIISEAQIKMYLAKVKGITDWPTPRIVKQVQAFLGFCTSINNLSRISQTLHKLCSTSQERRSHSFIWASPQETSFWTLIQAFITAPVLTHPDHSRPFQLITDASDFVTGIIFEQPDTLN